MFYKTARCSAPRVPAAIGCEAGAAVRQRRRRRVAVRLAAAFLPVRFAGRAARAAFVAAALALEAFALDAFALEAFAFAAFFAGAFAFVAGLGCAAAAFAAAAFAPLSVPRS